MEDSDMNDLSWLIYFADLSDNLGIVCAISAALVLVGCVIGLGYGGVIKDETYKSEKGNERWLQGHRIQILFLKLTLLSALLLTLSALFPSKTTVYLIAASEAGETVVQTETARKAVDAIDRYLDSIGVEAKTEETTGE